MNLETHVQWGDFVRVCCPHHCSNRITSSNSVHRNKNMESVVNQQVTDNHQGWVGGCLKRHIPRGRHRSPHAWMGVSHGHIEPNGMMQCMGQPRGMGIPAWRQTPWRHGRQRVWLLRQAGWSHNVAGLLGWPKPGSPGWQHGSWGCREGLQTGPRRGNPITEVWRNSAMPRYWGWS